MEAVPHIDITDPARIQALLDDPRNFSWRAVDSETLDTWSPDLGLTAYPQPSVYRAGAVASSGISSTLRQRFWQTVEGQADHTGMRYIGIVIYLAAGESAPMELRLASQEIGRVEPGKGDNRLHLIVVDKAVEFIGEMEIFQLTAPGPGTYRIEQFVLLHERPEASCSNPKIENLSYRIYGRKDDFLVFFHFTTSTICSVKVDFAEANRDGDYSYYEQSKSGPSRLHSVYFDIGADYDLKVTITAWNKDGESASETVEFSTAYRAYPGSVELAVPVQLLNTGKQDLAGLPLIFGLPLPRGVVNQWLASKPCLLEIEGTQQSASMNPLRTWDDDSVRWGLIESQIPAGLSTAEVLQATLQFTPEVEPDTVGTTLAMPVTRRAEERLLKYSREQTSGHNSGVDSSFSSEPRLYLFHDAGDYLIKDLRTHIQKRMSLSDWRFNVVLANGVQLRRRRGIDIPWTIEIPQFTIDHEDGNGVAHLRSSMRLQFYPDQSFFKLHHRLEVISPALAPAAAGGDLPAECDADMRENIVGDGGEESTILKLRSFSLRLPFEGARVVQHRDETWQLGGSDWQLRHDHDLAHEINGDIREDRAPGHIMVDGDSGALGIGVRNFWQTYPKAITVGSGGIDIDLFPERAGRDLPGDEDAWHRLYFWLDGDGYKLKAGMALSSEILIDFGGDNPAVFDWLESPVLVRPDIDYLNSTGALNPIGARQDSPLPDYDALTDRAIDSFYKDREHFRAYGQVNLGDWYGESAWSWGNNEYDPSYCAYTEFLRGGDPRWARWAAEAARHLADIDTVNFSSDASEIGGQSMHMPGHLGGYLPPYFRSKMGGTKSIPSHTWVEGPLLHFLLTGDQAVYDSLLKTKDWLLQRRFFDYYDFSNAREAGWHLIHLCALADSLDDADCLNAASIIVERVLERQEPEGGWVRNLGEPHCGCGYPRCRGEAGFMVGVLLSGLKRYHHLTGEDAVAVAIIGGARWLIRETFDEASGHFRYTSCPKRTLGGTYQHTQYVLEALASAWELSGDPEIGAYLRDGLPTIGMFPGDLDHLGLGKALSQQMRYVPTITAALERRSLESVEATND